MDNPITRKSWSSYVVALTPGRFGDVVDVSPLGVQSILEDLPVLHEQHGRSIQNRLQDTPALLEHRQQNVGADQREDHARIYLKSLAPQRRMD